MSPRLVELTRDFNQKPGASPADVAALAAAVEAVTGFPPPADYLEFLRHSDGATGFNEEDFYTGIYLYPAGEVMDNTEGYEIPERVPKAVLVGLGGGGGIALVPRRGRLEFIHADLIAFEHKQAWTRLGDSLEVMIENVLELRAAQEAGREPVLRSSLTARTRAAKVDPNAPAVVHDLRRLRGGPAGSQGAVVLPRRQAGLGSVSENALIVWDLPAGGRSAGSPPGERWGRSGSCPTGGWR